MYYKHSGRFSLGGLIVSLLVGSAGALVLAAIYSAGIILIPEVHLAAFATIAFGGLIGVAVGYGLVWGKVRNERVALAAAATGSCLALYGSWAMWVHNILKIEHVRTANWLKIASHPGILWKLIRFINHYGTWGFDKGSPTTGWMLWLIWTSEAATVIGLGMLAAWGILHLHPFCETCGGWCQRATKILLSPPANVAQLKAQLEVNDLRALENLGPGSKNADHLTVALHSCESCRQFHTMSLTHFTIQRNKYGKQTIQNKTIMKHFLIDQGRADAMRLFSERTAQAANLAPKANAAAAGKQ